MRLPRPAAVCAALLVGVLLVGCASAPDPAEAPRPAGGDVGSTGQDAGDTDEWPTGSPQELGLRGEALRAGARAAKRLDSTCFAVVRNGRLVHESNWGTARDVPREVFSITKSVTSTLVGIAVRDGDLGLDDRVSTYVPQWRGTPSEAVTVRHLLSNDSGRFWSLDSDYGDLLRARSRTAYAVGLSQQHAPGTAWAYNNAAIQVLEPVLEKATGMPVAKFARTRLFKPLGMDHSTFVTDRADDAAVFYGLQTTCLDVARFGSLFLGRGRVTGTRLLDKGYVKRAVGRSSTELNAAYGYLWWLNRPGTVRGATDPVDALGQPVTPVTGQLAPDAPENLYAALGFGGQVLLVDPTSRTMVIRLGRPAQPGDEAYGLTDAAQVLTRALR